jgi:formyltetrahydrofolate synthetase
LETEGKWFSNTTKNDIQGYGQLKDSGDIVFLASSLKDVMTLNALGYEAVAFQSEMQMPSEKFINHLKQRFGLVVVLYDNDFHSDTNPGQTMANKICNTYQLINVIIPAHYKSKDVSDLVKDHDIDCAKRIITIQLP